MEDQGRNRFLVARVNTIEHTTNVVSEEEEEENGKDVELAAVKVPQSFDDDDAHEGNESEHTTCQKTWAHISLRHLTRDVLPKLDNYRNLHSIVRRPTRDSLRPTLDDLHNPRDSDDLRSMAGEDNPEEELCATTDGTPKFGWVKGVLVRCLLNIWGVMLFLRLSWVTGQAGILCGLGIVLGANVVTTLTALSMSAISTNGQIKGGGTYYMISRSLGPEFGGAIGLIFSFANAVAAAMYIVGFCESLLDLLKTHGIVLVDGSTTDIRIIGSATLVVLFLVCVFGGMKWESRMQIVLLLILVVALVDFLVGACVGPLNDEEVAMGFLGFNKTIVYDNLWPDFRPFEGTPQSLFSVFAVFFPACTGVLAGANISGDLKDPSSAIPKGSLLAILLTCLSYVCCIVVVGSTVAREATGEVSDLSDWSFFSCSSLNRTDCKYGLLNSFQAFELVSIFGPLIYAGCFAATLSSALASLVSAPRVFQALCRDRLFPFIHIFGRGYGGSDEPYAAYGLTMVIVLAFILVAELNSIASIISNFFLAAYALINFSCFHASYQKSPGWRPTFKYYNMWLSLLGAVLCGAVMVLIEWWTAVLTAAILLALWLLVAYRKIDVNWGSSVQSQAYRRALEAVFALSRTDEHVKTFRPQILLFCGDPAHRPPLLHFAHCLTKNMALLIAAECHTQEGLPYRESFHKHNIATRWLKKDKVKAFYVLSTASRIDVAARAAMRTVGLGKLRPNIVMLGYKSDWAICSSSSLKEYFGIIHSALDMHFSLCILRVPGQTNFSGVQEVLLTAPSTPNPDRKSKSTGDLQDLDENVDLSYSDDIYSTPITSEEHLGPPNGTTQNNIDKNHIVPLETNSLLPPPNLSDSRKSSDVSERAESRSRSFFNLASPHEETVKNNSPSEFRWKGSGGLVPQEVVEGMHRFSAKQPKGTIDVWWLFDDGGLTLLLPYILSTRSLWESCKLRIFCLCGKRGDLEREHQKMTELMRKFRIDISDVIMVDDIHKRPSARSVHAFEELIAPFRGEKEKDITEAERDFISEEELRACRDRTRRQIRLKELLIQHSNEATLIVMTLPVPVKDRVSAPLYLAWLETLTKDLPPFLLVRGNQTSVLTFYF